jgi:branched-chain amino acid transport system ATP-binding protein
MTVVENLLVALDFGVTGHGHNITQSTAEVMAIIDKMGLGAKANVASSQLSQVELRKMELARAMAARPKLLISDEAMAGLSGSEIDEVLDLLFKLNGEGITIIMIEHIMHAVMKFSRRVMCLDAGTIIAQGEPKDVMKDKRVQEAYLGA